MKNYDNWMVIVRSSVVLPEAFQANIRPESSHHEEDPGQNEIDFRYSGRLTAADNLHYMIAGVLDKVSDMTAFLNPTENFYKRFGSDKAPANISWSSENRSQLVRIPAAVGEYRRAELRSPDPMATHQ